GRSPLLPIPPDDPVARRRAARPRPRPPATTRARGAVRQPVVHPARRIAICTAIVAVVFSVLTARVAQLQLMSGDHYQRIATEQALHTIPISAERGSIFDRNGRDLALSVKRTTVYADPTLVADPI